MAGRRWRAAKLLAAFFAALVLAVAAALFASRPQISGAAAMPELSAPVAVQRDALGHTTLEAASRLDIARATGFIHAQERFLSMDFRRRLAAGEMAALFGSPAVERDLQLRPHRFRHRARRVAAALPPDERALLTAYAEGVNRGLEAMPVWPFPYFLMLQPPQPWQTEDSILTLYSMYLVLQGERWRYESTVGLLHELFGASVANFLAPVGTHYDAPLDGTPVPLRTPTVPGPEDIDLRQMPLDPTRLDDVRMHWERSGSNAAAVAGALTAHGGALIANDMHLVLLAPNLWYRMHWHWHDGRDRMASGLTLPGSPWLVAGSNGHIAWGFTNSNVDSQDLIALAPGEASIETIEEPLEVRFAPDRIAHYRLSDWGPIVTQDRQGRDYALRWTAHWLEGKALRLGRIELATSLQQALHEFRRSSMPPQNVLIGDRNGNIAWTIGGPLFRRDGHDGRIPRPLPRCPADAPAPCAARDPKPRWLPPADYPTIVNPPDGRLWSANSRHVGGAAYALLGDGRYTGGMRTRQIRDRLREKDRFREADLLVVQLDTRADFLNEWHPRLLRVLDEPGIAPLAERHRVRDLLESWDGYARTDSAAYRLVRTFRKRTHELFLLALQNRLGTSPPHDTRPLRWQLDGPLTRILEAEAQHFLPQGMRNMDELLALALRLTLEDLTADGRELSAATWGEANPSAIRHPLSHILPWLSPLLDPPRAPQAGDLNLPRVERPSFGASNRTVVSPGREAQGILHMPTGQSGHPLSPYYNAGHEDWLRGRPSAFLPGLAHSRMMLEPSEH